MLCAMRSRQRRRFLLWRSRAAIIFAQDIIDYIIISCAKQSARLRANPFYEDEHVDATYVRWRTFRLFSKSQLSTADALFS